MDEKLFGVYEHDIYNDRPVLMRGFDEKFWMPHSRHTTVSLQQIKENRDLELLAGSEPTGAAIVRSLDNKHIFVFGHAEYDWDTLNREYVRDIKKVWILQFLKTTSQIMIRNNVPSCAGAL